MPWTLTIVGGPAAGSRYQSREADLVLVGAADHVAFRIADDSTVSGVHCLLEIQGASCRLRDLESSNGSVVNGRRVDHAALRSGDRIRLGTSVIDTAFAESATAEPAAPLACALCGRLAGTDSEAETLLVIRLPGAELPVHACSRCQRARHEAARAARPAVIAACLDCQRGVSERADADGRAAELAEVAHYACQACADARAGRGRGHELPRPRLGDYRLLSKLGGGGFGDVFCGWHEPTGRLVAVKTMKEGLSDEQRMRAMFQREMAVARELVHPNVVRWLDGGEDGGVAYFAAELMLLGNLESRLEQRSGALPVDEAMRLLVPCLRALEHAHARGFVHRDLKPENLLVTRGANAEEIPKVGDLGLAKSFHEAGGSFLTELGQVRGSLMFMSEEQLRNFKYVGPTADVYSMGVTLYYLLSGRLPIDFPSPLELARDPRAGRGGMTRMLELVLDDARIPLLERRAGLPARFAKVVDRSVRRASSERVASVGELREALEAAV